MGGAEWRVRNRVLGKKLGFGGSFCGRGRHNVGGASCPDPPPRVRNKNRGKGISIALIIHSLDPPTEVGCGGRCPPYNHGPSFFLKVVFQVVDVVLVECFDFVFYLGEAFVHSVL